MSLISPVCSGSQKKEKARLKLLSQLDCELEKELRAVYAGVGFSLTPPVISLIGWMLDVQSQASFETWMDGGPPKC